MNVFRLPVIENCDDCGACCMSTPVPPFAPGEDAAYALPPEALETLQQRRQVEQEFERMPCAWFDSESRRCRHYEFRPEACRRFEINSDLCRLSRWDHGL